MPKTSAKNPTNPPVTYPGAQQTVEPVQQTTGASQEKAQLQEQQAQSQSNSQPPSEAEAQSPAQSQSDDTSSREARIREAAYAAYQRRGGERGSDVDDWLQAESEIDRPLQ